MLHLILCLIVARGEKSQLLVGVRCANRQQTLPSSVLSVDSMHIGVHAAANRSPFTIFYNPRACPLEFVIPLAKYRKSAYGSQVSVGMRFGIMFETDEFGKTYEYHCYVSENGSCRFKGPFMHRTRSHLQRVLGDDNVLIVKFANVTDGKSSAGNDCFAEYNKIAKEGTLVGLRRYRFLCLRMEVKKQEKKTQLPHLLNAYLFNSSLMPLFMMVKIMFYLGKQFRKPDVCLCMSTPCQIWPSI